MAVNTAQVNNITGDSTSNAVKLNDEYSLIDAVAMQNNAMTPRGPTSHFSVLDNFGCDCESFITILMAPFLCFS